MKPEDLVQEDRLEVKGINSQGFGTISKLVMRDRSLSPEAKAIYAYICSYAGSGCTAFPSVSLILADLGMSRPRYYKHRKLLEEKGYITVFQGERQGSRYAHNVYRINQYLEVSEGADGAVVIREKRGSEAVGAGSGFGKTGSGDCGKPSKPQVNEESSNIAPDFSPEIKPQINGESSFVAPQNEPVQNLPTNSNRVEKSFCSTDLLLHPSNLKNDTVGGEQEAFKRLCDSSVQRNLLGGREGLSLTRISYGLLLSDGYRPDEIQAAWACRQSKAHQEKKEPGHYPQLKKWLESEATDGARAMIEERRKKEQNKRQRDYRMAVSDLCDRDPEFAAMHASAQAAEKAAAVGELSRSEAASAWQPIDAVIASFLATKKGV